jgi:heme-degrading monooxygenase HmoA
MPYVLLKHKVRDYADLKAVFVADTERRKLGGSKGGRMFQSVGDATEYFVLLEWDDVERAQKFAASYELREAVEWAGDAEPPQVVVMEEILATDA